MTQAEATRKTLINLARRQQPGLGSSRATLRERSSIMQWPDLSEVLTGVPWAVVGAVATRLYMPERATRVLDVVIALADAPRAAPAMRAAGWQSGGRLPIGGDSWSSPDGQEVDIIEGADFMVAGGTGQGPRQP